ncbi:MAG: alpha-E domain-containing protein, partial [Novosphingobium sp.]
PSDLGDVLAAIRRQATLVRGAMDGTMLRNEIFNFARIGTFIERADNTARILDVKYYVLLPSVSLVGSNLDNVQWETILRSVSGERSYRWLNSGGIEPRGIARFMMLDGRFPRSLAFCYGKLRSNIDGMVREYGQESHSQALINTANAKLQSATVESIVERGLHEFIGEFIASNQKIAAAISADYRFVA